MRRVLVISASVHVAALALLPIMPDIGDRQPLAMDVYTVELVDLPSPAPVEEVVQETVSEPEPVKTEPVKEEAPIPESPVKQPRREIVPPPPKRAEKSLEERIAERLKQEEQKKPETSQREARPAQTQPTASMQVKAGSVVADYYLTMLQGKITRNWKQPSARFTAGESPTVRVSFTVMRSGDIANLRIARSSNWPAVDQSAVQAVRSSAPFAELPGTYLGDRLDVTIDFTVRQ
jgi:protein TonB